MRLTLAAMTLASSMILVDQTAVPLATPDAIAGLGGSIDQSQWLLTANIIPLAALMVFGGRLGDLFGLRRVFVAGAIIFAVSTAAMGGAQDMPWAILARAVQGCGAALMMPTALAIVSTVYPKEQKGAALGILAGAAAFFAALGPVLGGLLASIDWRLVFLVNVPLALTTIFLTLRHTPDLKPDPNATRELDLPGVFTFALAVGALVFGLSQGPNTGWSDPATLIPLIVGAALIPVFILIEKRSENPMLEFRLFRHLNFVAANVSQFLAGMVELGLGFLTPFFLLLVVGVSPATAGIALIPATIPIILAGPLAGKAFDRFGGRWPLTIGFLVLALSGILLAIEVPDRSAVSLIPGLLLQGLGLGIVLTVNDPTGLTAVDEKDSGEAAGMINTSEQLGGAIGIAVLAAVELGVLYREMMDRLAGVGINATQSEVDRFKEFIVGAEQTGLNQANPSHFVRSVLELDIQSHVDAFQVVYLVSAGIALAGAFSAFFMVGKGDRRPDTRVFGRRSRWVSAGQGRSPAITRRPPPETPPG